uniref:ethanolamine kinase n=1 Tax=Aegilops tauschii TaxID=37682 RepID=M8BBE4_AEGTA
MRDLCKELVKEWSSLDSSCFSISTVSGGITNMLLKVSVKEGSDSESSVTVRLYGPNTDLVIDRERELQGSGLGYLEYLRMEWFRHSSMLGHYHLQVYTQWLFCTHRCAETGEPAINASANNMKEPRIAAEIAKQLQKFHQVDIPGSKEPQLWNDVFKFLKKASVLKFEDNEKQKRYEMISFREIQDEVKELKDLSDLLHAPVVFAHNDLLSGNLMLNDLEEKLYFIDFEYGSYSYRGFDIANHFNEYAGFECDYNLYPDKDVQYHFFRNYLSDRPSEVQEQDLDALYTETNTFRLASHLYWALWALIQARVSPIDFDYLGYFFLRLPKALSTCDDFFHNKKSFSPYGVCNASIELCSPCILFDKLTQYYYTLHTITPSTPTPQHYYGDELDEDDEVLSPNERSTLPTSTLLHACSRTYLKFTWKVRLSATGILDIKDLQQR